MMTEEQKAELLDKLLGMSVEQLDALSGLELGVALLVLANWETIDLETMTCQEFPVDEDDEEEPKTNLVYNIPQSWSAKDEATLWRILGYLDATCECEELIELSAWYREREQGWEWSCEVGWYDGPPTTGRYRVPVFAHALLKGLVAEAQRDAKCDQEEPESDTPVIDSWATQA